MRTKRSTSSKPISETTEPADLGPERTRKRRSRRSGKASPPEPRQPLYRRMRLLALLIVGTGIAGITTQGYRLWQETSEALPDTTEVLTYARNGTMTIKADDKTVLQQIGPATREKVGIEDMPQSLIQAFLASEDRRFYQHQGIDYTGILRAIYANIQEREVVEGASTITQQLARIVFLGQEQTFQRKFREALLAYRMEQELEKDDILERYLNLVYLGSGAYGVADAAWVYFSKSVDELTLPEVAMIAGMAPAPSYYSPLVEPDTARQRRNIVLRRMQEDGFISEAEAEAAIAAPLEIRPSTPKHLYSEIPYFTSYVQQQLRQILTPEELELGGLTVETTLSLEWQKAAEDTIQETIEGWGPGQNFEQAALVAIDPRSGQIKAMVGGNDFNESQFNRAVQAQRQPGSTFKAFVYTAAIAAGFSPYDVYTDAKYVVDGYEPKNYGDTYRGDVSMRQALMSSINIVAVKVLVDVGFEPVIDLAQAMGIKSDLLPAYSLALGASEVNLLELTSAYGTLAAEGKHHQPHAITRIYNRYGELIYDASDLEPKQAVDADTAAIVTWMLEGVVQGGTGSPAALSDRAVAGKTGTSERNRDLWFVGYIPQLVVGVWLGNDDSSPTWGASSTAAATWQDFMAQIVDEIPVEEFPELPEMSGREGTITAQPVKPARVSASSAASSSGSDSYSEDYSGDYDSYDSGYSDDYYYEPAESESYDSYAGDSGAYDSGSSSSSDEKFSEEEGPKSPPPTYDEAPAPPPEPAAPAAPEPPPAPPADPPPAPAPEVQSISPGPKPVPLAPAPSEGE